MATSSNSKSETHLLAPGDTGASFAGAINRWCRERNETMAKSRFVADGFGVYVVISKTKKRLITHCGGCGNSVQQQEQDAKFLAKLLNSHDTLVQALKDCITDEGASGLQEGLGRQKRRLLAINVVARAAIEKVEGP